MKLNYEGLKKVLHVYNSSFMSLSWVSVIQVASLREFFPFFFSLGGISGFISYSQALGPEQVTSACLAWMRHTVDLVSLVLHGVQIFRGKLDKSSEKPNVFCPGVVFMLQPGPAHPGSPLGELSDLRLHSYRTFGYQSEAQVSSQLLLKWNLNLWRKGRKGTGFHSC